MNPICMQSTELDSEELAIAQAAHNKARLLVRVDTHMDTGRITCHMGDGTSFQVSMAFLKPYAYLNIDLDWYRAFPIDCGQTMTVAIQGRDDDYYEIGIEWLLSCRDRQQANRTVHIDPHCDTCGAELVPSSSLLGNNSNADDDEFTCPHWWTCPGVYFDWHPVSHSMFENEMNVPEDVVHMSTYSKIRALCGSLYHNPPGKSPIEANVALYEALDAWLDHLKDPEILSMVKAFLHVSEPSKVWLPSLYYAVLTSTLPYRDELGDARIDFANRVVAHEMRQGKLLAEVECNLRGLL
jgi:hypothetical protein